MWIPQEIGHISARLRNGHRVNRITVRELLQMFKAERRGLHKVNDIRTALNSLGLQTDPDFESTWIDGLIRFRLTAPSEIEQEAPDSDLNEEEESASELHSQEEQGRLESREMPGEEPKPAIIVASEGIVETAVGESVDPTFRIGSLPAANKELSTVGQDDSLKKAVTKMLRFDYSQLPIMHGEREVKGMISWKSIALRYSIGGDCCKVQHCSEDAQVVDANGTLFEAIPTIITHGYVLVRHQQDRRIIGIVTASDLSLQFQQLAEPFLLLREIELHIRQLLEGKVSPEDLHVLDSSDNFADKARSISELNFGGYIRLLQRPEIWEKLSLNIDQSSLTSQLEEVREIRNDVMHFDPDPMTTKQLEALKTAAKFMQNLYELLP